MSATANIPAGAAATQEITVTRDMTVAHFHEHMPEVYGTPIMIYHLEVTAEAAIREYLPEGWITVKGAPSAAGNAIDEQYAVYDRLMIGAHEIG